MAGRRGKQQKPKGLTPLEEEMWPRFVEHRLHSKARGIAFLMTWPEWRDWWMVGDRWPRRRRDGDSICMARRGDRGPYHVLNVDPLTRAQNTRDALAGKPRPTVYVLQSVATRQARGFYCDPARRPSNPLNRPVATPDGTFPSASLAAEHYGISSVTAAKRAREGLYGWRYTDARATPPIFEDLFAYAARQAA